MLILPMFHCKWRLQRQSFPSRSHCLAFWLTTLAGIVGNIKKHRSLLHSQTLGPYLGNEPAHKQAHQSLKWTRLTSPSRLARRNKQSKHGLTQPKYALHCASWVPSSTESLAVLQKLTNIKHDVKSVKWPRCQKACTYVAADTINMFENHVPEVKWCFGELRYYIQAYKGWSLQE